MKIAILGDCHFGVRNGAESFDRYFEKFFSDIFFPHLINNNITTVIQVGDIFDNRKTIHINSISRSTEFFFRKFEEYGIRLIILVGNHDSFYKDTIKINSPKLLLQNKFNNIKIIDEPTDILLNDIDVTLVPWICKDNYKQTMELINNTNSSIAFGHLELRDFAMYKGILCEDGMDDDNFRKFEFVFTGHYHHRSNKGNIYYLGTPYELTWHDDTDPKGFHTFDLGTRELTFVQNPYKMFNKIYYDDAVMEDEIKGCLENNELASFENSYIKVVVKNKLNLYLYDMFIDALYKVNPIDLVIVEDMSEVFAEELNDIDDAEDTLTILNKFIDSMGTKDLDNNRIKMNLTSLYHEAMGLQII